MWRILLRFLIVIIAATSLMVVMTGVCESDDGDGDYDGDGKREGAFGTC